MGIRKFEAFDSKSQTGASLEIEGDRAPSAATLTLLFGQLKSQVEAEIDSIEGEEEPELSDSMTQQEFDQVRQKMEDKKRKSREPDQRNIMVIMAEKKRKARKS